MFATETLISDHMWVILKDESRFVNNSLVGKIKINTEDISLQVFCVDASAPDMELFFSSDEDLQRAYKRLVAAVANNKSSVDFSKMI